MAVSFKVRERKVKINGKAVKIRFAQSVKTGDMDLPEICDLTSKISAVSEGDVRSVLNTLTDLIIGGLRQGRSVALGELGRFRISLSSKAALEGETFTAENIRRARVTFYPGGEIRRACREIRLKGITQIRPEEQPVTPPITLPAHDGGAEGSIGGGL